MGISELRRLGKPNPDIALPVNPIGRHLVRAGTITASDAVLAETVRRHCDTSFERILQSEGLASEDDLLAAHARRLSVRRLTSADLDREESLETGIDPRFLLRHAIVALRLVNGKPALVSGRPESLASLRPSLPPELGRIRPFLAPAQVVQDRIARDHRDLLRDLAETRVPETESCRRWGGAMALRLSACLGALILIVGLCLAFPVAVFGIFAAWACFTLLLCAGLKSAAVLAALTKPREPKSGTSRMMAPLPKVSILVPLFRETEIAHALIARLSRLTYPKCLLDVILVLEEEDALTQATLAGIDLPSWVQPVIVPDGTPRTKPRAMNYALDFCKGDLSAFSTPKTRPTPIRSRRLCAALSRCHAMSPVCKVSSITTTRDRTGSRDVSPSNMPRGSE